LFLASVLGIGGAALCYVLMRRTTLGQRFDSTAYLGSLPINPAVLGGKALNSITAESVAAVLVILVVIGFVRRRPLLGVAAAFAAGLTVLVADLLKDDVFSRPFFTRDVPLVANTFPSGHTAAAVSCVMALVLVSPARWRGPVAVLPGAYGWITAIQAQTTSSHHPSDVIGAAFLAFAAMAGMAGLLAWFRPVGWARARHYALCQVVLGIVAVLAVATTVWGLVKVAGRLPARPVSNHHTAAVNHDAFITGVALSVVVVVGLLMALLALLGGTEFGWRAGPGPRPDDSGETEGEPRRRTARTLLGWHR
jgi:membrane-associated phospholipid phosphatase